MTDEEARDRRAVLLRVANAKGFGDLSEDLAQQSLLDTIRGKESTLRPDWAVLKAYQKHSGHKETAGRELRLLFNSPEPIESALDLPTKDTSPISKLEFEKLASTLPQLERIAVYLRFVWDFELQEIGDVIGYNNQKVDRLIRKALATLKALTNPGG